MEYFLKEILNDMRQFPPINKWVEFINWCQLKLNEFHYSVRLSCYASLGMAFFLLCFMTDVEQTRNLMLSLAPIVGFPFLVWRSDIADKTHRQDIKSHMTDMYIKAVEQLASDKETIRLAGTVGLVQILEQARSQSDKETENNILDVLWCFMVEKSRDVLRLLLEKNDDHSQKIPPEYNKHKIIIKHLEYFSQFRVIIPVLPKKEDADWWRVHAWGMIFLKMIDLSHLDLRNGNFSGAILYGASFYSSKLQGVNFGSVDLKMTNLSYAEYDNSTILSRDKNFITPQEKGMINIDEEETHTEKSPKLECHEWQKI